MIEGADLLKDVLEGAALVVATIGAQFRQHRGLRSEVRELRRIVGLLCDKLGVEVASGPHLIAKEKQ